MAEWYEDEDFWVAVAAFIFADERVAGTAAEVDAVVRLLGLPAGAHVLDIPCGIGRHAIELARRGFTVTGVDRTAAYVERAARDAASGGVPLEVVRDDMRTFTRPSTFDAALCLFNSFSYFDDPADDRRFVTNVFASLRPGAPFIMDLGWIGREIVARHYQPSSRHWDERDGALLLQETTIDPLWSRMDNRWTLVRGGERREMRFSQRLYGAAELVALLRNAGFASAEVYGSLGGRPFDQRAQALVAVARK